ncbi:MAG: L-fucose isomerase [Planctomycetota bacterium]
MATVAGQTADAFSPLRPFPAIGIRPTIDGRRDGVRESLEGQVIAMATAAAELIATHLTYPDGSPVRCVIADTCIGGAAEAAACARQFAREGVGVSLTVTPCWCYGSETMDLDPTMPKAVWGFNGTERPGAVYLAAVLAAHAQKGVPAFGIYGQDVQDAGDTNIPTDVTEKILRFARAGLTVAMMKGRSYLSVGGTSMGIAGSIVSHDFFQKYLGMRVESVDMIEVLRRMERGVIDGDETERALTWVEKNCRAGIDVNPPKRRHSPERQTKERKICVQMTQIIRDLMVGNPRLAELGFGEEALGHDAIAGGFQGQRHWTDHMPNGDFAEAILNSSFDWDGPRSPYVVATENDSLNAVPMLFGRLLTNTAQVFADVRTYWSSAAVKRVTGHTLSGQAKNGIIHLINSGPAALDGIGAMKVKGKPAFKHHWDITPTDITDTMKQVTWCPAVDEYFRGGGFSTSYKTLGGIPVTMTRLSLVDGLGPILQVIEGWTVELPTKVHQTLDGRTNPTWPTTWFAPRLTATGPASSVYSIMAGWSANHCALAFGHVGGDFVTLAALLRIPVSMHNVTDENVFRPASWGLFGAHDTQGADYRACAAYGPTYR